MKMRTWYIVTICILIGGCETPLDIVIDSPSFIQIDAVFFANEPVPEIVIRRTFNVTGTDQRLVHRDSLFAAGAFVRLLKNGSELPLEEVRHGHFVSPTNQIVEMGDEYEIDVRWEGQRASAVARVPIMAETSVSVVAHPAKYVRTLTLFDPMRQETDSLDFFDSRVDTRISPAPPFLLMRTTSESLSELVEEVSYPSIELPDFQPVDFIDMQGNDRTVSRTAVDVVRRPSARGTEARIIVDIIVAEPIYGDYVRNQSDFFTPVTITNVDGGVGLFIGAVRHRTVKAVPREW